MSPSSLNSADWEVLDYPGNPVPGDPDAISSLAVRFRNQAGQAQDRAGQLSTVRANNEGRMLGGYAADFENKLAELPSRSTAFGECYQSCGEALSSLASTLEIVQSRAAEALEQGMQADSAYRQAAAAVCDILPGTTMTGVNEPGPVWRELTAEWAAEAAMNYAEEDPALPDMAQMYGQNAQDAEMERQAAISNLKAVIPEYQDAVTQCSQAIQDAMSGLPAPEFSGEPAPPPTLTTAGGIGGTGTGAGAGRDLAGASTAPGSWQAQNERLSGGDPVDVATGDVILAETDVTLPGILPLVLERTHRSSWRTGRWFGRSWMSSFDQRLQVTGDRVIGAFADGRVLTWIYPNGAGDSPLDPVTGPMWPLRRNRDGSYTVTDPQRGLTWRFEPRAGYEAAAGRQGELPLVSVADRIGHEIVFSHDGAGRPVGVSHSGGYRVQVTVTGGHVAALTLNGRDGQDDVPLRSFEYDAAGNLSGVVNSSGLPLRFTYDSAGRLTSWTDRNDYYYRYAYDAQGRCVRGDGPDGALSGTFSYEPGITRWTDVAGAVTTYEITETAEVAAITDPLGNVTRWERDSRGRVTTRVDPLGRVTQYAYDDRGNLTAVTRSDGSQVSAEYDGQCQPVLLVNSDGSVWRQEYDSRGNRTGLIAPDGTVTEFDYDDRGHLARVTDPDGAATTVICEAAGLPVAGTGPDGARTRYDLNQVGMVIRVIHPNGGVTRLDWTADGRLAAQTFPDGARETWSWDAEDNLSEHVNAAGSATRYEYGPFDKVTGIRWPDGTRSEFRYDHQLRLTEVSHSGLTWRYEYDLAARVVAETDYNDATTNYAYDAAGQLTRRVNAVGQEVVFGYDTVGNLIESSADGDMTAFGYDPAGRLLYARNTDAEIQIDRDALGRVTSETCNGRTVTTEYDMTGRVTRRITPSGAVTTWEFDQAGRPAVMTANGHQLRFGYDAAGQEIRRELPGGLTFTQDWDLRGRLVRQALTGPGQPEGPSIGHLLQRRTYSYRADGFPEHIDDLLAGDRTLTLDPSGRVTGVTGPNWIERYAYDQVGNLVDANWPSAPTGLDSRSQGQRHVSGTLITQAGGIRYRHDQAGRVTTRQRTWVSRRPDTWRYQWDADNRLTAVTTPDGATWEYRYDPFGRRISKHRLTAAGQVAEHVGFTWDGPFLVEQSVTAESRENVTTWDYQPGTFTPLTQAERTSPRDAHHDDIEQRFYAIITDLVGTPSELAASDGTLAGHQQHILWGDTLWAGAESPLRFSGQYADPETGLHYNYRRFYDPASAGYLTADPLGLLPGPNAHSYVSNPQAFTDPLGLVTCKAAQAFQLKSNVDLVHQALHPFAQTRRATGVIRALNELGDPVDVYAGSGKAGLTAAQANVIRQLGGVPVPSDENIPDADAEVTALKYISKRGWRPVAGAASRAVCPWCANELIGTGATLIGPRELYFLMGVPLAAAGLKIMPIVSETRFIWEH